MSMRRPRIKPVANIQLNAKRKSKNINDVKTDGIKSSELREFEPQRDDSHTVKGSTISPVVQGITSIEDVNEFRENSSDTPVNRDNLKNKKQDHETAEEIGGSSDNWSFDDCNNTESECLKSTVKNNAKGNENIEDENNSKQTDGTEPVAEANAFKCPAKVDFQRSVSHISNSGVDDVFYSDIEENALHMDMEKQTPMLNCCPISPSKNLNRQRIRPTPYFGQRRNSFIGTSPSHTTTNEDSNRNNSDFVLPSPTRTERHHSVSFSGSNHPAGLNHYHHHTSNKYLPSSIINSTMGRIRTESGCSVFSDTNTSTYKSRKHEDHKQNVRKEYEARFFNGVPEKSVIKMSDLIYYNPVTNPMEQKSNQNVKQEQSDSISKDMKPFEGKQEKELEQKDVENDGVPVPQLKLNAKGELILDDKSLVIETTAEQEARKVLANSSLIYLDENTGMNGFYSRQKRTREWLPSETIKFYRCLQNVGSDFSLMVSLFPNRTRRDLKLKFKKEERKNGHLINKALLYPKQFNLEALKQQIDAEEKLRAEQSKNANKAKDKSKQSKKRKLSTSAADRVLQSDVVYQNENVQKPKRVRKPVSSEKNDRLATSAIDANVKETCKNESNEMDEKTQQTSNIYSDTNNTTTVDLENQQANGDEINIDSYIDISGKSEVSENDKVNKSKRLRRRTPNKVTQKDEIIIIKEEIIKIENKQDSNNAAESVECVDGSQLQTEMDELLNTDVVDINYSTGTCDTQESAQIPQPTSIINTPLYSSYVTPNGDNYYQADMDIDKYDNRTIINLDDGSVNVYSKMEDYNEFNTTERPTPPSPLKSQSSHIVQLTQPVLPPQIYNNIYDTNSMFSKTDQVPVQVPEINRETCCTVISEQELNEEDIQSILTELADGSLVLVSSLDPDDPDKVLNEIYMIDKNTGDLCKEPLNIPDNIVQCILSVLS